MKRKVLSIAADQEFVQKAIQYAEKNYADVVYLNPNSHHYPHGAFRHILAFGGVKKLEASGNCFDALRTFINTHKDWIFGYLSYDLKNQLEHLSSDHEDMIGFETIHFFIPENIFFISEDSIEIHSGVDPEKLINNIRQESGHNSAKNPEVNLIQKIPRKAYLEKVGAIRNHILKGDLYETNFCMEFYGKTRLNSPLETYHRLNDISPMPFSCFVKQENRYLLCASPERFIKKEGKIILSQPIKGTAKRSDNIEEDNRIKDTLLSDRKERSENIMIVDLVRNDLSRTASAGSVKVDELCAVYSFPNVHQMISTVKAEISPDCHPVDVIREAFPMGSMTGAPKVRAMEIIEQYEESRRGLFSGSVGYFSPEMDFDFNVVIRSILYNKNSETLSFQAGSAITWYADAEKEYEECLLKTAAIREVFGL